MNGAIINPYLYACFFPKAQDNVIKNVIKSKEAKYMQKPRHVDLESEFTVTDNLEGLLGIVANAAGVEKHEIISKCRNVRFTYPRFCFCYVAVRKMKFKLSYVGTFLGGRDHTTILNAVQVFENELKFNKEYQTILQRVLGYGKSV